CSAFLIYNWHPARIFMGDAGSLFLGFLITVISLLLRTGVPPLESAVAVILIMGAAVFDSTLVVISRARTGRSIMLAGTDHTSHRLVLFGYRPQVVTTIMVLSTAFFCALGVLLGQGVISLAVAVVCAAVPAAAALILLLRMGVYVDTEDESRSELVRRRPVTGQTGDVSRPLDTGAHANGDGGFVRRLSLLAGRRRSR